MFVLQSKFGTELENADLAQIFSISVAFCRYSALTQSAFISVIDRFWLTSVHENCRFGTSPKQHFPPENISPQAQAQLVTELKL